ncbi:MAG: 3-dehydroquinate synthase [Myxococcales bacterium]|nr:3-dehydroquinate synthase [Myxococcales bacterium]
MTLRRVPVALATDPYDVVVSDQGYAGLQEALLAAVPGARDGAVLVTDDTVGPLWAGAVRTALGDVPLTEVSLPAGEVHKTSATWLRLVDELLAHGVRRTTPVIALGGGVVGDVAGFAAACTLRGLPFVTLPTTLLAMVDASVGGKTAVNHPTGKNLLGAFHQPSLVWAALDTLGTLADVEVRSGLGEVVKTAAIGDASLLEDLGRSGRGLSGLDDPMEVVARCVAVKARVVAEDAREAGVRMLLNAGHTVGHALETALGHGVLPHGCAVAVGLVAEARYALARGVCEDGAFPEMLRDVLDRVGALTSFDEVDESRLLRALQADKKGAASSISVPLPVRAGVYTVVPVSRDHAPLLWSHHP